MKALAAILLALLCGCSSLRDTTHATTALDASTTVIGVSSGLAVEANPMIANPAIFAGLMVTRVLATEYVNGLPEPQRTTYLSGMSSLWLGGGISNVMVFITSTAAAALTPIAPIFGIMAAVGWWASNADRRLFAQMCAEARIETPTLRCEFRGETM